MQRVCKKLLVPGEALCSNSVDGAGKITIGNGCIASLDGPHWFRQCSNSRTGVEHDLCSVHSVHHPVLRMVATIANVDGNSVLIKKWLV